MADQSLFFSPDGRRPLAPSGSRLAASASSSQASRTGFKAIMLLWDRVRDSNLGRALGGFRLEYLGYFNVDGWIHDGGILESINLWRCNFKGQIVQIVKINVISFRAKKHRL